MQRLGPEVARGGGQAELRQDLLPGGHGPADVGRGVLQPGGNLLGVLIIRRQGEQRPRLLDALGGRLELLAGPLERREPLVELGLRAALLAHQVLDPLVVLLRQDQLGLRRPQRGDLGPQAGDAVAHLLLLPLDGPPGLLQRRDRRADLVARLRQVGASPLEHPDHPVDRQPRLLPVRPLLLDEEPVRLAVQPDQERPPLDIVIVLDQDPLDHVGDPAGDRRGIPRDEGVVGRDVREVRPDPRPALPGTQHRRHAHGQRRRQPAPRPPRRRGTIRRDVGRVPSLPMRPVPRRMPGGGMPPRPRRRYPPAARSFRHRHVRGPPLPGSTEPPRGAISPRGH